MELLGLEHPSTLTTMVNLAFTFWTRHWRTGAIELMSEVVQDRLERIGSDHPDTIPSISLSIGLHVDVKHE